MKYLILTYICLVNLTMVPIFLLKTPLYLVITVRLRLFFPTPQHKLKIIVLFLCTLSPQVLTRYKFQLSIPIGFHTHLMTLAHINLPTALPTLCRYTYCRPMPSLLQYQTRPFKVNPYPLICRMVLRVKQTYGTWVMEPRL